MLYLFIKAFKRTRPAKSSFQYKTLIQEQHKTLADIMLLEDIDMKLRANDQRTASTNERMNLSAE